MKPLSLPRLLVIQRQRIERAFTLEVRGYGDQAARVWAAADRLARALESRWREHPERRQRVA